MAYAKNNFFYKRFAVEIEEYEALPQVTFDELGFTPTRLIISRVNLKQNDPQDVIFSFNGDDLHGEIFETDDTLVFDELTWNNIFMKLGAVGDPAEIRIWAWRR